MDLEIRDCSQWFPGVENNVADSLSRNLHLSDDNLTAYLCSVYPSQIPSNFRIVPLPNEIVYWLTSLLQPLPVNKLFKEKHMPTKNCPGSGGPYTANQLVSTQTSSLIDLGANIVLGSLALLLSQCGKDNFQDHLALPWVLKQFEVPSIMWLQHSENTTDPIQHLM